jgi:AcrR family transcriptional regulator
MRVRQEKQAKTRTSLLRSAAKLFRRKGMEGTSVEEIASDAGFTKGAFYANFKSKEELFLTMLDDHFQNELERMDRALSGEGDPGQEAQEAAEGFIQYLADPEWPLLYFQFAAHAARDEDFRRELATRARAMREKMTEIYERWSENFPHDPPAPLDELAAMTDFMASGFILERTIDPEIPDDLLPKMMGLFFLGCQAAAVGWEPPPVGAPAKAAAR